MQGDGRASLGGSECGYSATQVYMYSHNKCMHISPCVYTLTLIMHLVVLANVHDASLELHWTTTTIFHTPVEVSLGTATCMYVHV